MVGLSQQGGEPSLHEVVVVGQRFPDAVMFHYQKTGAVRDAPFFVKPAVEPLKRRFKLLWSLGDDGYLRIVFNSVNQPDGIFTLLSGSSAPGVENLVQDQMRGYYFPISQRRSDTHRLFMQLVVRGDYGKPIAGIGGKPQS